MALDSNIVGALSGTGADVNASRQLKIVPETVVHDNPQNVGAVKTYGENDQGQITAELRDRALQAANPVEIATAAIKKAAVQSKPVVVKDKIAVPQQIIAKPRIERDNDEEDIEILLMAL